MFQHHITDLHIDVRVGRGFVGHISSLGYTQTPKMDSIVSHYIRFLTRSNVMYGRTGEHRLCRR